jgi:hypothetical protein
VDWIGLIWSGLGCAQVNHEPMGCQKALLQRVLMTIERAFSPVNRKKSDRHARVAFEYLSDPSVFDNRQYNFVLPKNLADIALAVLPTQRCAFTALWAR